MVLRSSSAKERQRQRVKVRYYRAVDEIDNARSLVQKLAQQHAAAVARHQQQRRLNESLDETKLALYLDAVALAAQLRSEKKQLMTLLEQRQVVQDRVLNLMHDYDVVAELKEDGAADGAGSAETSAPFSFEPLTLEDCSEFVGSAVIRIREFMRSQAFVSTNTSLFGWRDRRQIVGHEIRISLQKVIHDHTPLELFLRAWKMLSAPSEFAQLYSASVGFHVRCIQTVDDSNVVYYGRFPAPDPSVSFHCLFLLSRLRVKNGYATLYQSIDSSRFIRRPGSHTEQDQATELWIDVKMWTIHKEVAGHEDQANIIYGGSLFGAPEVLAQQWMMEMLLIALRWENMVVGVRPLLSSVEQEQ